MARLKELEKWPAHEEHIWSCDCASGEHYLRISWDNDDPGGGKKISERRRDGEEK